MRRRLSRPSVLLAVATLTLTGLSALPAHALTGTAPTLTVSTAPGDPGILVVTATSDSAVTGVEAQVRVADGGALVRSADLTRGDDGRWRSARLVLQRYHVYSVTVRATDADGDTAAAPGTFPLHYLPQGVVQQHTVGPLALDAGHVDVTATGVLARLDPRTGLLAPAAGETVRLGLGWDGSDGVTDASGAYSLALQPWRVPAGGGTLPVTVTWQVTTLVEPPVQGRIDEAEATTTTSPGRLVMDASTYLAAYPAPAKVTGVVQREVGGKWVPVAGAHVADSSSWTAGATTGADGRFTLLAPSDGGVQLQVEVLGGPAPFLTGLEPGYVQLTITDKTTLTWAPTRIDARSRALISGTLTATRGNFSGPQKVYVQQSSDAKTWTTLGYVMTDWSGNFSQQGYLEHPSGYFRLRFFGSSALQASSTAAVRMSRIDTRVVRLDAAPEPVAAGRTIRVAGTVQRFTSGAWRPMPKGQVVELFFRAKGGSTYTYQGSGRTTSTGAFSIPVTARRDGYWSAVWFTPLGTYVNAYSSEDYVDVR